MVVSRLAWLTILAIPLVVSCAYAQKSQRVVAHPRPKPNVTRCSPRFAQARSQFIVLVGRHPGLAAAFLRAIFHDCITTSKRSSSGCNGSLRLRSELEFVRNLGLDRLTQKMEPIVRRTCISYADAFQIGVEAAMIVSGGGPPFANFRLGRNRIDAVLPDPVHQLPGLWEFPRLKAFYRTKGFNVPELVVSVVGSHSLGKFFGVNFTPTPNRFSSGYAINLWHVFKHGKSLPGFNTLSSDRGLVHHAESLRFVKRYGDTSGPGGAARCLVLLRQDFKRYLSKLSKLPKLK